MTALQTGLADLSKLQQRVLVSYRRALASRGVQLTLQDALVNRHCYWELGDRTGLPPNASDFTWIWHSGPDRQILDHDERIVLLPRNDLFEIRDIENTTNGWREYRRQIDIPWSDKRTQIYFCGHCTGTRRGRQNSRYRACSLIRRHYPKERRNVGLLPTFMSGPLRVAARTQGLLRRTPEPLHVLARYQFVLSLWGNHPFNPRLYRGLESGSLVFHQATPTVRLLEDGILVPGEHYVEVKPDLSDLVDRVDHYLTHPAEAEEIARSGHMRWMHTLFSSEPYTVPNVIWERWTSQPRWHACCEYLNSHKG